jgi:hypothetical protein
MQKFVCFFRSPGTGLYSNLEKYNLPNPTAIFDIRYEKLRMRVKAGKK